MKILLAGATGYIGSKTIFQLLKNKHELSIIQSSKKKNTFDKYLKDKVSYNILKDSPNKKLKNLDIKNFDFLVYFFWANLPNYDSHLIHKKNYIVSKNFINFLFQKGLKKIYTIGSCYEYLGYVGEVSENLKTITKLPYPFYKNKLRNYLDKKYNSNRNIRSSWIRLFYVYSKDQRESSLIPQIHDKKNSKLIINSSNKIIDIYHVNSHVRLIVKILFSKKTFKIVNCCSGKPIKLKRFVLNYIKRNKLNVNVDFKNNNIRNFETDFWGSTTLLKKLIIE